MFTLLSSRKSAKSMVLRYQHVPNRIGATGADVARALLDSSGLNEVAVTRTQCELADHYDPRTRTLRLSPSVYSGRSIAAVAIAGHETGHALQQSRGYLPERIRSTVVPVAPGAAGTGWLLLLMGLVLHLTLLGVLGIALALFGMLFAIVTLHVEFDAGRRALEMLTAMDIVEQDEVDQTRRVLLAASLTYVNGAATVLIRPLYARRLMNCGTSGARRQSNDANLAR